jgi:hypothetical protein
MEPMLAIGVEDDGEVFLVVEAECFKKVTDFGLSILHLLSK